MGREHQPLGGRTSHARSAWTLVLHTACVRALLVCLSVVATTALPTAVAGCSGPRHVGVATVHGKVVLSGGAPALQGQPVGRKGTGSVLFFTDAGRTGTPAYTTAVRADGTYSAQVEPGRYYLATTAATFNASPAPGPSIVVRSSQDLNEDIGVSIK